MIDLGTGARDLGAALMTEAEALDAPPEAEILLSHLHLDHIMGAPFFAPFYDPRARIGLRCGLSRDASLARDALGVFAAPPFFPVQPMEMGCVRWGVFGPGDRFEAAGFQVRAIGLNHPGGACGFRVETPQGAICMIGDHEHGDPKIDAAVAEAVSGAAILLFDATYDEDDYPRHRGWGHSTWQKGVELARGAGIGLTLLHHHGPEKSDEDLAARDAKVQAAFPQARLARQGMVWRLTDGAAALA